MRCNDWKTKRERTTSKAIASFFMYICLCACVCVCESENICKAENSVKWSSRRNNLNTKSSSSSELWTTQAATVKIYNSQTPKERFRSGAAIELKQHTKTCFSLRFFRFTLFVCTPSHHHIDGRCIPILNYTIRMVYIVYTDIRSHI